MQVDSKPSLWPCIVMLAGLLLCCLAVPRYWQTTSKSVSAKRSTSDHYEPLRGSSTASRSSKPFSAWPGSSSVQSFRIEKHSVGTGRSAAEHAWSRIYPPPTIEELVEVARLRSIQSDPYSRWRNSDWPQWSTIPIPLHEAGNNGQPTALQGKLQTEIQSPNPLVVASFDRVGRLLDVCLVAEQLVGLADRIFDIQQLLRNAPAILQKFGTMASTERTAHSYPSNTVGTLRLIGPGGRAAETPELTAPTSTASSPASPPTADITPFETESTDNAPGDTAVPLVVESANPSDPWWVPQALIEQLERLKNHPTTADWAVAAIEQLRVVSNRANWDSGEVTGSLQALGTSAREAIRLSELAGDDRIGVELRRAHWALSRRLDCWRAIDQIHIAHRADTRVATRGSLHSLFAGLPQPTAIRADLPQLSGNLEAYELSRDPSIGRQVIQEQRVLRASPNSFDQSLAEAVEQHYRNANIRIAITAELLNRLVAQQRSEMRAVRDRIAGSPVRGRSETISNSAIRLQPAMGRWQLAVETQGVVESNTVADGGSARLRTFGNTDFVAHKTIVVDTNGVHLGSTAVGATNFSHLAAVRTKYDWVPLFGAYARSRAVQEYRVRRQQAKAEVEAKVAAQAEDEVERETREAIERIERDIRSRFTDPIAQMGIDITPIELTTTEERIVARLRVAGNQQMGSHTPRPRALSDSLASLQLHETALTNAAVSLELNGSRFTAPELQEHLRRKYPRLALARAAETNGDTAFEFAYRDAVQFRIGGGRLELLLALTSFEHEGRRTRDFIVHAYYVPVINGLEAELVRSGPLGIEGRLGAGERARLHNAFNAILAEDRRLPIVRLENPNDARLAGLMITQLVLEDGWLGVAIGPRQAGRVAERSRSLR